jgi:ElaB/YqjD/DUF883 family membrane-anchored ribosome-binding protein
MNTNLADEAQALKSRVADAVDDGVYAARRALKSMKRGVARLEDLQDGAILRVRRRPLRAVGLAAGVGLVLGIAIGLAGARRRSGA